MRPIADNPDDRIAAIRDAFDNHLCSDSEMAVALGVSVRTVHRLVARGMPIVKIGRRRLFNAATSAAWLAQN